VIVCLLGSNLVVLPHKIANMACMKFSHFLCNFVMRLLSNLVYEQHLVAHDS
jgi:hypothetical protein